MERKVGGGREGFIRVERLLHKLMATLPQRLVFRGEIERSSAVDRVAIDTECAVGTNLWPLGFAQT